jgi:hypothetical protein
MEQASLNRKKNFLLPTEWGAQVRAALLKKPQTVDKHWSLGRSTLVCSVIPEEV